LKIEDWKIGRLEDYKIEDYKISRLQDYKIEDLIPKCWDGSRVLL
jgi:hypothetical protein